MWERFRQAQTFESPVEIAFRLGHYHYWRIFWVEVWYQHPPGIQSEYPGEMIDLLDDWVISLATVRPIVRWSIFDRRCVCDGRLPIQFWGVMVGAGGGRVKSLERLRR